MSELKPLGVRHWKHGACHKNFDLYNRWQTIMHRCYDKSRKKYKDYGGRGIVVCEDWHNPNAFINWALASGYSKDLQLDRKDNNGNYEPANCRWVTAKQNSRNRRNTKYLTVKGVRKCVAEWCETIKVSPFTVYWWIREKGVAYAEQRLSKIA